MSIRLGQENMWSKIVCGITVLILASGEAWAQGPRIDAIAPAQGSIAGGTLVIIRGVNLSGSVIRVDRTSLIPLTLTDTEIRIQMPAHDTGYGVISVQNSQGAAYAEYLYIPPRLQDLPPGHITTVAGAGFFLGDGRPATRAVAQPVDIVVAPDKSIYISDQSFNRVRRIAPDGIITTVAGTGVHGIQGHGGDGGLATNADLRIPLGIALDSRSNLYIVDLSHRVRRVDATTGIITTVAGEPHRSGFAGDGGPATRALLHTPVQIVADTGGTLFILEQGNNRIRRITPDGTISTYAGTGIKGHSGDGGPASLAQLDVGFGDDGGMAIDAEGNLYFAETYHGAIRKVEKATGTITTVARIHNAGGVTVAPNGDLYVLAQSDAERQYRIAHTDSSGRIIETWGKGNGFTADGVSARDAGFGLTRDIELDSEGNILLAEPGISRLRRIDRVTGVLSTLAGIGPDILNEEGPALATFLGWDLDGGDIAVLPDGSLLLADNSRFRLIDRDGNIRTLGRTREIESIPYPVISFDFLPDGSIAFADCGGIRKFTASGIQPGYIAGSGRGGFAGDGGPATKALFSCPNDVAADSNGNLFVADVWNNRIRRIDAATGIVTTFAGIGPEGGTDGFNTGSFCGDGGPASSACLNSPWTVLIDEDGTLFIGDSSNNSRIRKIDPAGRITTFVQNAGTPLLLDRGGNIFATSGPVLARYSPRGTFSLVAGGPRPAGFSGDGGRAIDAQIGGSFVNYPGMAIDAEGNLFFRDGLRLRAIRYGAVLAPFGTRVSARTNPAQTTSLSRAIGPLEALLRDENGDPASHIRVDFTSPSSGPSAVFTNGERRTSVVTDRNGIARVTAIADCRLGEYTITAAPLTIGNPEPLTVRFAITNQGSNPVPQIDSVSTTSLAAGRQATVLITGRDFSPCTTAQWNGANRPTRFIDTGLLEITIPATDLPPSTSGRVTLTTQGPGGGTSNEVSITVTDGGPEAATNRSSFSILNNGGFSIMSAGSGRLSVGYGRVQPDRESTTPPGVAIFGYRQDGVLVTEAAVPAERALRSGRSYAQVSSDRTVVTGIAIANPSSQTATINFYFTNAAGIDFGEGSTTIPPNSQIAKFLDEAPFGSRADIEGTFSFTSNIPVAAIALSGFTNQRGELIITTLPVVDTTSLPASGAVTIPHYAAGGGWTTHIILVNPTNATMNGTVFFSNPVTIGAESNCCFSYSVPPRGSQKLIVSGLVESTASGSIQITPAAGEAVPTVFATFSFTRNGVTISEAAVTTNTGSAFHVYVESSGTLAAPGNIQTGIALASTSSVPATVAFELNGLDGTPSGIPRATVTLPPSGQMASFLGQIFTSVPASFSGILRISSTAKIAVAGLRGRYNERGDFLIATTPPINEAAPPTMVETFFPHIVDSGGYTTQIILFGGRTGAARSGAVRFFDQTGQPLNLTIK